MKAALYARVSTRDKGQDTETQLRELRAYAAAHGWTITEEYIDQESGSKPTRAAFQQMLSDARRRRFDVLLFWSLDRLSREGVAATIGHLQMLHEAGVKFRSLKQPEIDTTATWGWVIVSIFAALAELERGMLIERTRAGLARAKAQGKTLGRPRAIVDRQRVKDLASQGWTAGRIAMELGISRATAWRIMVDSPTQADRTRVPA